MKKIISLCLVLCLSISLFAGCASGSGTQETTEPAAQNVATAEDIAALEALYEGRVAAYGDTHCHSASSTNSDGKVPLTDYKEYLLQNSVDFATIVDHGQATHMWHEDWDDTLFVGGSEPGLSIKGIQVKSRINMDYSMIFTKLEGLEAVLNKYIVEYAYNKNSGFFNKNFMADHAKVAEIIQFIKDNGGMWVHVHPLCKDQYYGYDPVDVMDYWFADEVGFEVTNAGIGGTDHEQNVAAYDVWVQLLNAGKRIWATCGGDGHSILPYTWILSTLYTTEKNPDGYLNQMKVGDMTAGPVGIRVAVGNTKTGSTGSFAAGDRVVIAAGDFHPQAAEDGHTYRLDVYDETGLLFSEDISTTEMNYVAFDARTDAKYYRANVYDVTAGKPLAIGNPVFNG